MNTPCISIIIPVYNAEKYIKKCLDSVINQTYTNLEIICVDDGSQDESPKIICEYQLRDSRVTKYQILNCGVSNARNYALRQATGEYVMFVDSDDWIEKDTCEKAVAVALEHSADVVMWGYVREFMNDSRNKSWIEEKQTVFEGWRVEIYIDASSDFFMMTQQTGKC